MRTVVATCSLQRLPHECETKKAATLAHKLQSKSTQAATVEAAASPAHTSQAPLSHTPPSYPFGQLAIGCGADGKMAISRVSFHCCNGIRVSWN